jgi:hypothetical protein
MYWKGKDNKKETSNLQASKFVLLPTYQHLAAFVFVPSIFGEKFPTAEF